MGILGPDKTQGNGRKSRNFKPNKNFKMDMFNVVIGTIAQTALVALPIYIVLRDALPIWITI
jgi:solute:Na+ symporter, SSS family